jgi:L-galactose dehydrogenase
MEYRPLGDTGLRVSALGLGAASLGGEYGEVDEAQAIATVRRAFELGVNVFDASPYYGRTRGETVLGRALSGLPRDRFVLATKCGRYGRDDFDFSPGRIRSSLDESLRRLQVDHIEILQLHDVEFGDLERIFAESLPALHALKTTGKVRFVGITGLPLAIFRRALAAGADLDVLLSYSHATLFDRSLLGLLPELQQRGIGVFNASPTALGLLSSHGPRDWHPGSLRIKASCLAAAEHCRQRGRELADLAVGYSCSLPGIASTFCGTASPHELAADVAAAGRPVDPQLLAEVQQLLAGIRDQTWIQGRPENNR